MHVLVIIVNIDNMHGEKLKNYSKLSVMTSKTFSSTQPSIPLGLVNKMLVVEHSGVSAFKVLPQSAKPGILY